jgi:hypothetical protein
MPKQRTAPGGTAQGATSSSASSPDMGREQQGESMVDEAKNKVQELASQAQEKAGDQVQRGVDRGKNRAADALGAVAQSLLLSGQNLREQNRSTIGDLAERAASRVERLADYVQNTDAREMANRVESFARREPGLFLGGAFALGLLGARFLKSSRREGYDYERGSYAAQRGLRGESFSRPRGGLADREVPIARTPYESDLPGTRAPGLTPES